MSEASVPAGPPPWEPPLAGSEAEHLVGALDRLRTTFRWKADGLDAAGLAYRFPTSALSLGGLLKHLASAEDYVFSVKLRGEWQGDAGSVALALAAFSRRTARGDHRKRGGQLNDSSLLHQCRCLQSGIFSTLTTDRLEDLVNGYGRYNKG